MKLLPSVLRTFLRPDIVKRGFLGKLRHCVFKSGKGRAPTWESDWGAVKPDCGTVTESAALQAILDAFLSFGASLSATFQKTAHPDLHRIVLKGRKALLTVFYFEFFERPNIHVGVHLDREARLHGTATQTEVSVKEMVHRRPKFTATHGNHKEIAREMLLKENGEQALKFLLRGGVDGLIPGTSLTGLLQDISLTPIFCDWLHSPRTRRTTSPGLPRRVGRPGSISLLVTRLPSRTSSSRHILTSFESSQRLSRSTYGSPRTWNSVRERSALYFFFAFFTFFFFFFHSFFLFSFLSFFLSFFFFSL